MIPVSTAIARGVGVSTDYVLGLPERVDSLYRSRIIAKDRSGQGKARVISVPDPSLQLVQEWIADFVRENTSELPSYVAAYETGRSIVQNALIHASHRHLLTLDIHHFFPSCTREMVVVKVFSGMSARDGETGQRHQLGADDVDLLASLSCYKGALAVGSPCSPFIANRIMLPVDGEIIAALPDGYAYSRYSDDISISSDSRINTDLITQIVEKILSDHGFSLNRSKTHCRGTGDARRVTGVFLTSDGSLSIGRDRKKELCRQLYALLKKQEGSPSRVLGMLFFCKQVEPEYFNTLVAKYATYGLANDYGGVIPALQALRRKM